MIRIAPSSVSRRPASARRRDFTGSGSTAVPARSKRSCTADATLLTFWPPGPDPLTKDSEISPSGITMLGVTSIAILINPGFLWRFDRPRHGLEHPKLALGNRYLHAVVAEEPPDRAIHVRAYVIDTVHGVGDP